MRISEPSFTDSGIDATGKTENQTCTRVDGRSAPSTLSLPKSARTVDLGMELRMSERSEHYDIHSEFQVPRMVNRSCGRGFGGETPDRTT